MKNKQKVKLLNGTVEFVHIFLKPRRVKFAYVRFAPQLASFVVVSDAISYSRRLAKKLAQKELFEYPI